MKYLNQEEINIFANKYLPIWKKDINTISLLEYNGIKEYLVNEHYLVIVDKQDNVKEIDLQDNYY